MKLVVTPFIVFIFLSSPAFACYKAELSDEENFDTCNELAQQDDTKAQYNLAVMFHRGIGTVRSVEKALQWYLVAAEQGHLKSQFNLGLIYHKGDGVQRDYVEAVVWYSKAAKAGHNNARYNLAVMYDQGQGIEQDYAMAYTLWKMAADEGHELAGLNIKSLSEVITEEQLLQVDELTKQWTVIEE